MVIVGYDFIGHSFESLGSTKEQLGQLASDNDTTMLCG
jgi:hypothetical protein